METTPTGKSMSTPVAHNETMVATAFSRQAPLFDVLYGRDAIIRYKRSRVRAHILSRLKGGDTLLELNCGTGEDALYFAERGFRVHATDLSPAMLQVLREKQSIRPAGSRVTTEACSFTRLNELSQKGPYDHLFSNFGGLNCTGELDRVLQALHPLVKPGGYVTLVIISRFCLWEFLLLLKGRFRTATRRFFSAGGRKAKVEDTDFRCWYYSPRYMRRHMEPAFELVSLEGLCTLVPPSYIEHFGENHPRLLSLLKRWEDALKYRWPWNSIGDYFIITFRKQLNP
jgi:ubiquinone/menaquinone biosynthesis C-methylase UbiE